MQIVEQTKRRSGWRAYRTLAALGVPRSVYYAWKTRESLEDRAAKPCRVYELLPEERLAICEFALKFPKVGYRKLTWMMVDAGVVLDGQSVAIELETALEAVQGVQPRVVHDHGSEFVNRDVAAVIKAHNLINIKTRARHPESNGIVERFNGTVRDESDHAYGKNYLEAQAIIENLMRYYN